MESSLYQSNKEKLFDDVTWLSLLHFLVTPRVANHSDVLSAKFLLSLDAQSDDLLKEKVSVSPQQELNATLKAFFEPVGEDHNIHAQCRLPARYLWLDEKLDLTGKGAPKVNYSRLEEWAKFELLDSVSLIMVSGYLGNPASTFGHLLVKLNNSEFRHSLISRIKCNT